MAEQTRLLLSQVSLENHPVLGNIEIDFDDSLTVIVGKNGAGKTTLLKVLAFFLRSLKVGGTDLTNRLHRIGGNGSFGAGSEATFRDEYSSIKVELKTVENGNIEIVADASATWTPTLCILYPQDRAAFSSGGGGFGTDELSGEAVQLKEQGQLESWWGEKSADEGETIRDRNDLVYRDPELEAIRNLITKFPEFNEIKFRRNPPPKGLFITLDNDDEVRLSDLSSGERAYILLMADIARRLQLTVPDLPLEDIPGIILIDELELKMHPEWQSRLITDLPIIFSKCQFIVTTHSPMVVSGARANQVRSLKQSPYGRVVQKFTATKGRSSDYLLQAVFGTSERDLVVQGYFEKFNTALDHDNFDEAEALLHSSRDMVEGTPADFIHLGRRLDRMKENSKS
jgi:predicted ATP-binding protein involved in virulence